MGKCMKSENPVVCLTDCSFHSHSFKHSSTLPPPISHPPCLDFPPVETLPLSLQTDHFTFLSSKLCHCAATLSVSSPFGITLAQDLPRRLVAARENA